MLMIYLWRSKTGLRSSDRIIWQIIAISLESALPPAISMLAAISLYCPGEPIEEHQLVRFFFILIGKLYTLGIMRTLNTRVKLREKMKTQGLGRSSLEDWQCDQGTDVDTRRDSLAPSTFCKAETRRPSLVSTNTVPDDGNLPRVNKTFTSPRPDRCNTPLMDAREPCLPLK